VKAYCFEFLWCLSKLINYFPSSGKFFFYSHSSSVAKHGETSFKVGIAKLSELLHHSSKMQEAYIKTEVVEWTKGRCP
jgi:hypothetical protein